MIGRSAARWSGSLVCLLVFVLAACGQDGPDSESAATDAGSPAADAQVFRLGFLPSERAADFAAKADTLAAYLEAEMGTEVEVLIPTAYEPLIEALRFGNLDASFMDAAAGWIAHERTGAEVVLAERREDGTTSYTATGFTGVDSDIDSLDDLVGRRTAHTSWTGSSGFVLPIGRMIDEGLIQPEGDDFPALQQALEETFESYSMAGGYQAAMEMLASGRVDAAFGADDAPERFLEPEDRARVRPFVEIGPVPSHVLMVAEEVSDPRRDAFVRAMLKLTEERPEIYRELYGVEGVVPATTEEHLGEFGRAVSALPGLHGRFLGEEG